MTTALDSIEISFAGTKLRTEAEFLKNSGITLLKILILLPFGSSQMLKVAVIILSTKYKLSSDWSSKGLILKW